MWAWGSEEENREAPIRGTCSGLVSGSKATLKGTQTPWSRPREPDLPFMLLEESSVRILLAIVLLPTLGYFSAGRGQYVCVRVLREVYMPL